MNVITRGIRNAFRNKIRTFSIVIIVGLSVGLALTMLVARQAVTAKIDSVKSSVGNTVSISPAGVRGFEGGGSALTESQLAAVKKLSHVTGVSESLSDRLTTSTTNLQSAVEAGDLGRRFAGNNGSSQTGGGDGQAPPDANGTGGTSSSTAMRSFTPPVTVVGTTSPTTLSSSQGGGSFSLKSGKVISGSGSDTVALIGSTLATKNNLKVGSTFTAYGQTITVAGIFDAGNTFANNQVIMPLKTVQTLSSQPGAITSATVLVDSVANVDAVTTAATKALSGKADVTNDATRAKEAVAPLQNIQTISLYSLIGAVIAGSTIILLTMIMIVRERRREIGVIKAIGASNITVVTQFAAEAITFTGLGSVIGIVVGVIAGNPITKLLVTNASSSASNGMGMGGGPMREAGRRAFGGFGRSVTNISATVGWDIIGYGLLVALVIAVIGSALASLFIAKIRPAEVMRAE